jgi:glycosidase
MVTSAITFVSCKKDDNGKTTPVETNSKYFKRLQQGTNPADDTVFLVGYDAQKNVESVKDSADGETWTANFDKEGNVVAVVNTYDGEDYTVRFTYNVNKQLIQAEDVSAAFTQRFTFEYADGRVARKNAYTKYDGSNDFELYRYYTYNLVGGNITSKKEYSPAGDLLKETKYTYTGDENGLKSLAYINNYYNYLGLDDVADLESLFNKNLIATRTEDGIKTDYVYTYNPDKQLTAFVVKNADAVYTRFLGY